MSGRSLRSWIASGLPWVWLNAGAVAISVVMVLGLLALIAVRGLSHFWPHAVSAVEYRESGGEIVSLAGELVEWETVSAVQAGVAGADPGASIRRVLIKTGNRDLGGLDFRWLSAPQIVGMSEPEYLLVAERREWGNFYGALVAVRSEGAVVAAGESAWPELERRLEHSNDLSERIRELKAGDIGSLNYRLERLRLERRTLELDGADTPAALAEIEAAVEALTASYRELEDKLAALTRQLERDAMVALTASGTEVEIPLSKVVRVYRPNAMGVFAKIGHYLEKLWEFVADDPREANTEGGIFPAIYGTVLMVLLMSVMVTPLGVMAAVYLREYARQGLLVRAIRVAVNNLAGVPSIVYGVFGLGFFVYAVGGTIDEVFFAEALPAPTFGTGGLMWASLTLALLTLPVVIVSTEEGLSRVPRAIREGSLALGATRAETLWRTVLPMASPAIMTGVILAVARAAGEVAPLMLVGVVKLAPSLPLDLNYPFLHAERKFMHLGFHIYDVGFQSPNVEAARPLVYATALLLVVVIVLLNVVAIRIRNALREKYRVLEN